MTFRANPCRTRLAADRAIFPGTAEIAGKPRLARVSMCATAHFSDKKWAIEPYVDSFPGLHRNTVAGPSFASGNSLRGQGLRGFRGLAAYAGFVPGSAPKPPLILPDPAPIPRQVGAPILRETRRRRGGVRQIGRDVG
ncbi:protein of unknown function [Pararobbsia alpina]